MATILNVDRDGTPLPMGNTFTKIIVSRETGARHVAVNYTRYEPSAELPQHFHEGSEDVLFVVTGSGWLKEGERTTPIAAGDVIFLHPGEVHGVVADRRLMNRTRGSNGRATVYA
jgi:quercetin dioxygenase-like cupin family protein